MKVRCWYCDIRLTNGDFYEVIEVDRNIWKIVCPQCAEPQYCEVHEDFCLECSETAPAFWQAKPI